MATTPTQDPIPSENVRDLKFNTGKIDQIVSSPELNYTDRFGVVRYTWAGVEYQTRTSGAAMAFATEVELIAFTPSTANVLAQDTSTGIFYYWNGTVWNKAEYQPSLDVVSTYRLGIFESGKNLYNYKTSDDGKYINESGVVSDNSDYSLSAYILVKEGVGYFSNYSLRFVSFFDEGQSYVGYVQNQLEFTIPENVKFVRITVPLVSKSLVQMELGGGRSTYEPYTDNLRTENNDGAIVSLREAMGYINGKNLFNPITAMQGIFISASGVLTQSATSCASDYIEIVSGNDYRANQHLRSIVFYDNNKAFISGSLDVTGYFTAPINAYFMRVTIFLTRINYAQVEGGRYATDFVQYGIEPAPALDGSPVSYPKQNIDTENIGVFEPGKNLLNPHTMVNGFVDEFGFYNPDGSTYKLSEFISIESSSAYVSNKSMRFASFYDANKAFMNTLVSVTSFSSPNSAKFVKLSISIANSSAFQLEKGLAITSYEDFYLKIKPTLSNGTPIVISSSYNEGTPDYYGLERLPETHMRMNKLTHGEPVKLNVALIGDSYTRWQARYALKLAQKLWKTFHGTDINTNIPPIGYGYMSFGYDSSSDNSDIVGTLVTQTGFTCAYNSGAGPDISSVSSSTAGATISWPSDYSLGFTTTLFFEGGSGVISYQATGMGSPTTIDLSASSVGMRWATLTLPTTGTGTTTITVVSGTVKMYGVNIINTAASGVTVHKLGGSGSSSANWIGVDATRWQSAFTQLSPDFVAIMLGTNDQGAGMAPSTFKANIITMIDRVRTARPTADIMLIAPAENNRPGGNAIPMSMYAQAMYEIARDDRDIAFLNLQQSFGEKPSDYAFGSARPWMVADGIHPDPETGGYAIAAAISRAILLPL